MDLLTDSMTGCRDEVLGTRLESATDDDRSVTVLLSDLHVPRTGGAALDDLRTVLARARVAAEDTRVVIAGDLFEVYTHKAQLRMGAWAQLVEELARTSAAGVSITVLVGNRDFLLGPRFVARTGVRLCHGGLRLRLGERRVLCLHGDELCLRDEGYQRAKAWLRTGWIRALGGVLPAKVGIKIGERIRANSHGTFDPARAARYDATAAALDAVFSFPDLDTLVFGHVHRESRGPWPAVGPPRGEVVVLPAFDEAGVHLRADGSGLTFVDRDGCPLPDPSPRQFT